MANTSAISERPTAHSTAACNRSWTKCTWGWASEATKFVCSSESANLDWTRGSRSETESCSKKTDDWADHWRQHRLRAVRVLFLEQDGLDDQGRNGLIAP